MKSVTVLMFPGSRTTPNVNSAAPGNHQCDMRQPSAGAEGKSDKLPARSRVTGTGPPWGSEGGCNAILDLYSSKAIASYLSATQLIGRRSQDKLSRAPKATTTEAQIYPPLH